MGMRVWMVCGALFLGAQGLQAGELVQPQVSAVQRVLQDDTKVANDYLAVMRDEIKKSAREKSGFSLFGNSKTPLQEALLSDLDDYLVVYGDKSLSVEAVQLKAILHNRMDMDEALAMDFLTIISAYAGSRYDEPARKGLKGLLSDSLKDTKEVLDALLSRDFATMPKQADRLFAMLSDISVIHGKDFDPVISHACAQFLVRYPSYAKDDQVQNILASHAGEHYKVGIYHYRTLLMVYPNSHLRADALLAIADIQRQGLKKYEEAAAGYRQVIQKFPTSEAAKHAYISLALTQSRHLKLYREALLTLNMAVEKYADDPVGKEALNMLGEIYSKKTKEYAKAVQSYRKLSDVFGGDDGLEALKKAEKIANSSMRDYALVIAIDKQMLRDYPEQVKGAEVLMHIGDIYADKFKENAEAINTYQQLIEQYPTSREAKKASSKIRKLEKSGHKSTSFF